MLVNMSSNVIQSLGVDYAMYFFTGTPQIYTTRAQLKQAVAACQLTLVQNTTQLVSKSASKLKAARGQKTFVDGTSQIVIPSSVTYPKYDGPNETILADLSIVPPTAANMADYWAGYVAGSSTAGDVVFTFETPVNLASILHLGPMIAGNVSVKVGSAWQTLGTAFQSGVQSINAGVSNVTAVKITVANAQALGGTYVFYGTEVTPSTPPVITHAVLTPLTGLTTEQVALVLIQHRDLTDAYTITLTAGPATGSGNEVVLNNATPGPGIIPVPITFAISGGVITGTVTP